MAPRTHTRRFPKPIRHDGRDYLTTEQVAKLLGVKTTTVYAYVSRGRMTSARIDGVDGSVFGVDEVEALMSGRVRRAPAGVVERIRTQLTLLQDDHLYYRGRDAADLARTMSFENVANILWDNAVDWGSLSRIDSATRDGIVSLAGPQARGLDLIRLTTDVLGARDAQRHDRARAAVTTAAATTIGAAVDVLSRAGTSSNGTLAQRLWPCLTAEPATAESIRVLDAALVLLADHDLSAGAVAARVAASARGNVYAILSAGLGAFDGPIHGGATTFAYRMLAGAVTDPPAAMADQMYLGGPIPGTGHVVYRHRDPRADVLIEMLRTSSTADPRVVDALEEIERRLPSDTFVNSDLALAALALAHRMRPGAAEAIFAVARMAGWTAHALEEFHETRLRFRPEGVYTGVRPTKY